MQLRTDRTRALHGPRARRGRPRRARSGLVSAADFDRSSWPGLPAHGAAGLWRGLLDRTRIASDRVDRTKASSGCVRGQNVVADRLDVLGCDRAVVPSMPEEDIAAQSMTCGESPQSWACWRRTFYERGIRLHVFAQPANLGKLSPRSTGRPSGTSSLPSPGGGRAQTRVTWAFSRGHDPVTQIGPRKPITYRCLSQNERLGGPEPRDTPAGGGDPRFPIVIYSAH